MKSSILKPDAFYLKAYQVVGRSRYDSLIEFGFSNDAISGLLRMIGSEGTLAVSVAIDSSKKGKNGKPGRSSNSTRKA